MSQNIDSKPLTYLESELLVTMTMKSTPFWVVTPSWPVHIYGRFGRPLTKRPLDNETSHALNTVFQMNRTCSGKEGLSFAVRMASTERIVSIGT
jgi:hypothetical protein